MHPIFRLGALRLLRQIVLACKEIGGYHYRNQAVATIQNRATLQLSLFSSIHYWYREFQFSFLGLALIFFTAIFQTTLLHKKYNPAVPHIWFGFSGFFLAILIAFLNFSSKPPLHIALDRSHGKAKTRPRPSGLVFSWSVLWRTRTVKRLLSPKTRLLCPFANKVGSNNKGLSKTISGLADCIFKSTSTWRTHLPKVVEKLAPNFRC